MVVHAAALGQSASGVAFAAFRRIQAGLITRVAPLGALERKADLAIVGVDAKDLDVHLVATGDDVLRGLDLLVGELGDVQQTLEAFLELDEDTEVGDLRDRSANDHARTVGVGDRFEPRILLELLEPESDTLLLLVDVDDDALDVVALLEDLVGMRDLLGPADVADMQQAVQDITGAAYGSAGERCMALSTVVAVGDETGDRFVEAMTDELGKLNVGISTDSTADYGPVVTAAHKQRIEDYIQMGVDEGAKLVVDGRNFSLQGYEKGFYVGPTLFDDVKPTMQSYQDEIFGPVLQVLREDSFEGALALPSKHQYGNGVAIFTRSGGAAREFAQRVNVGMVGINVPIPVPVAYHSFGGWKRSAFGDANQHGMEGVRFYTQTKTVTQRWPDGETQSAAFNIPVME